MEQILSNIPNYLWLIVAAPFAGAAINLFFGRFLSKGLVGLIACLSVLVAFLTSVAAFYSVATTHHPLTQKLFEWIVIPGSRLQLDCTFVADQLSAIMILVVTGVGFLIHVYSIGYMHEDKRYSRYFSYLNLFTGFMLILVLGSNMMLMFVGWEGVGLCSYLLIGFWFEKKENAIAGMKAFIVNRIGDLGFTIGMLMLFLYAGTLDFGELRERVPGIGTEFPGILTAIGLLLFVGATGKSAQLPLYVWLPDAMAGPTPVSALIHAATMVTAGVYMLTRMNFLYVAAPVALTVVAIVGALTAVFAATIGLVQNDIKKVLAYSTVSQLGYMFLGVGVGAFTAAIFHLMTHAFFKACLFLGSGSVIHGMGGEQDIRKMGGLRKYMPWTFATFLISTLAIAGIPPFSGFFSKDEILWKAFSNENLAIPHLGIVLWALGAIGAGMTAFYMFRLVFKTFMGTLKSYPGAAHHDTGHGSHDTHAGHGMPHESPFSMVFPLVLLSILAIVGGWVGIPHALGQHVGTENYFEKFLEPVVGGEHHAEPASHGEHHEVPVTEYVMMGVSVAIAIIGIALAHRMYIRRPDLPQKIAEKFKNAYRALFNKYWVDELYFAAVVNPLIKLNELLGRFDTSVIDGMVNGSAKSTIATSRVTGYFDNEVVDGSVNATATVVRIAGKGARKIQTGNIRTYVRTALVGALVLISAFCLWTMRGDLANSVKNLFR